MVRIKPEFNHKNGTNSSVYYWLAMVVIFRFYPSGLFIWLVCAWLLLLLNEALKLNKH